MMRSQSKHSGADSDSSSDQQTSNKLTNIVVALSYSFMQIVTLALMCRVGLDLFMLHCVLEKAELVRREEIHHLE